jgi:hypothetical protein
MRMPKPFEEYLKEGIIKKIMPDKSRANFLIDESRNSLDGLRERVEKIGINEKNSNSIIKDCYDIIMELIRAKLLMDGFNSSGAFAHEAEVSYLKELSFLENEIIFINELRFLRNGITYYGKIMDEEYAAKVFNFLNKTYPRLLKSIEANNR